MPADGDTPRGRRSLGTDRLAAFSDGVFSIAATLLVLDIAVHPPALLKQVLQAWPGYVAYVVSFLTIGAAWLVHTALTDRLSRADPVFLQINLLVLLVVVLIPHVGSRHFGAQRWFQVGPLSVQPSAIAVGVANVFL